MKLDALVEKYIFLRDKKAQIKAEYDAKVGEIDQMLDRIEAVLLQAFQDAGMDSVRTSAGTAYKSVRTSAQVADWDAFRTFVQQNDPELTMIERRCNKTAVEQFKAANDGSLPPGLNWREELVVNIRRSA